MNITTSDNTTSAPIIEAPKIAIVTGVSGQMGSYFIDFLLEKGHKVIGTVRRLSVKNHKNFQHISSNNFILEPMDLGDANSINNLIEKWKPDYFINCAANSFVPSSWDFPEQHIDFNGVGVLRQLEAIRRFSPHTKYINFGSSEEFGDVIFSPQDEIHPPRSRSIYGASKVLARQIIKVYRESYNLHCSQCWCFNYESPRRGSEFISKKVTESVARIHHAINNNLKFEPLKIGNIYSSRDWSHAKDFIDGVWKMLNQDKNNIKEYVFSSNQTQTVKVLIEKAFKFANINGVWVGNGKNEKYVLSDYITKNSELKSYVLAEIDEKFYRPADVELLYGCSDRARSELDWTPKYNFDQLIKEMVEYDIKNYNSTYDW